MLYICWSPPSVGMGRCLRRVMAWARAGQGVDLRVSRAARPPGGGEAVQAPHRCFAGAKHGKDRSGLPPSGCRTIITDGSHFATTADLAEGPPPPRLAVARARVIRGGVAQRCDCRAFLTGHHLPGSRGGRPAEVAPEVRLRSTGPSGASARDGPPGVAGFRTHSQSLRPAWTDRTPGPCVPTTENGTQGPPAGCPGWGRAALPPGAGVVRVNQEPPPPGTGFEHGIESPCRAPLWSIIQWLHWPKRLAFASSGGIFGARVRSDGGEGGRGCSRRAAPLVAHILQLLNQGER